MKLFTYQEANDQSSHPILGLFIEKLQKGIALQKAYSLLDTERDREVAACFVSMLALISSAKALRAASAIKVLIEKSTSAAGTAALSEDLFFPLSAKKLLAPIPRPPSIRDFLTFETHVRQSMQGALGFLYPRLGAFTKIFAKPLRKLFFRPPRLWYEIPGYYKGNPSSTIGHGTDILWPHFTEFLDYELEIGIYIGKQGSEIPREKAREFIAGYTIYNDVSARDMQFKEMQLRLGPSKSKDFDTGNVMGPFLVTPDELKDSGSLEMVARINGRECSRGNSRDMFYGFEDLIAYVSKNETLFPGDFFGSGTVGNGCALEHGRWLRPGDTIELEVEGLGILKNRVVRKQQQ